MVLRDDTTFTSDVYVDLMGPVMGRTILEMEEPEHRRIRNLAGHAFRQKTLPAGRPSSSGRWPTR